jgi:hypothetical protein
VGGQLPPGGGADRGTTAEQVDGVVGPAQTPGEEVGPAHRHLDPLGQVEGAVVQGLQCGVGLFGPLAQHPMLGQQRGRFDHDAPASRSRRNAENVVSTGGDRGPSQALAERRVDEQAGTGRPDQELGIDIGTAVQEPHRSPEGLGLGVGDRGQLGQEPLPGRGRQLGESHVPQQGVGQRRSRRPAENESLCLERLSRLRDAERFDLVPGQRLAQGQEGQGTTPRGIEAGQALGQQLDQAGRRLQRPGPRPQAVGLGQYA